MDYKNTSVSGLILEMCKNGSLRQEQLLDEVAKVVQEVARGMVNRGELIIDIDWRVGLPGKAA